jgi:hypothetical protein
MRRKKGWNVVRMLVVVAQMLVVETAAALSEAESAIFAPRAADAPMLRAERTLLLLPTRIGSETAISAAVVLAEPRERRLLARCALSQWKEAAAATTTALLAQTPPARRGPALRRPSAGPSSPRAPW